MNTVLHAPKVDPRQVRVNFLFRGEPAAWKRTTQSKYGRWRLVDPPENIKAKSDYLEAFTTAYPRFQPIDHRRIGVQFYFETYWDSKDADNLAKLPMDCFRSVIWSDDRQIKELYVRVNPIGRGQAFMQMAVYLLEA